MRALLYEKEMERSRSFSEAKKALGELKAAVEEFAGTGTIPASRVLSLIPRWVYDTEEVPPEGAEAEELPPGRV